MTTWNTDALMHLATAYWKSAALSAAVKVGLFDALGSSNATADEVAEQLGASHRHVEALMDALSAMEILVKQGRRYHVSTSALEYLSRSSPRCLLDALRLNGDLYPLWGKLAECVREGKPALPPGDHLGGDGERTRRFVMGMHSRALAMAPALLPSLDLTGYDTLLDLGAGPGTFSRLLLERYPNLRVTLVDLLPVLAIAEELYAPSAVAKRSTFHPGDYRQDSLPSGYDAVLFCGALHQETPESARNIVSKIARALRPGGRAFVVDMMLDSDRLHPEFSALFSLNMLLTSTGGQVFSGDDVVRLIREAGFGEPCVARPEHSPYWIIAATKPVTDSNGNAAAPATKEVRQC